MSIVSCHYYGENNDKKVIPVYCGLVNESEHYDNIIDSIVRKNKKLINEYINKLTIHNIKYDYYNLVIYSEGIPASVDENKLFNKVMKIDDLKYKKIAMFLWNKIMVIHNNTYEIFYIK